MKILVTGGAGFIGSQTIQYLISKTDHSIINIDKLTYAGNLNNISDLNSSSKYSFEQIDICDQEALQKVFAESQPDAVLHLAAESHVDRSIATPSDFVQTNIVGTFNLLEVTREYFSALSSEKKYLFRFHHVSTDEVYGDLKHPDDMVTDKLDYFKETSPYRPSSPYSASKASSDHLVRAWGRTFNLPIIITNCSNNYGPSQNPEKLIPKTIINALKGEEIPVYGSGRQIRDWLYVADHADALHTVLTQGKIGETYNIGGNNEIQNIDVVKIICEILDEKIPDSKSYSDLITFVKDRPGHDRRYAIDTSKMYEQLGWSARESFRSGIDKTIDWYIKNRDWWQAIMRNNDN